MLSALETKLAEWEEELLNREAERADREEALGHRESEMDAFAESIDAQRSSIHEREEELTERERALSEPFLDDTNPNTNPLFNPDVEYTPEQEALAILDAKRDQWIQDLDYDVVGGVFWEDDMQVLCIRVLDADMFEKSDTRKQGQELGLSIRLIACKYSWNELTGAVDKLEEAMVRFQIASMGPSGEGDRIWVETMDVSEKNTQAIRDYCGFPNIDFTEVDSMTNPGT